MSNNLLKNIDINKKLINNDALFNNVYYICQKFDIIPDKEHYGVCIDYQDILVLKKEFLTELYDTIVDWVYDPKNYNSIKNEAIKKGKSEQAATSEVIRKAQEKFRGDKNTENLLIQGQLGELLLFHFIQKFFKATPLLRKMKITTSNKHERFGADAIHFKFENNKPIIILGEAKTYTSEYSFNNAFEEAIKSILTTYANHREELYSYLHEDLLDSDMNKIAEMYLNNTLKNFEVRLVSLVVYNETKKIEINNREEIHKQIKKIIEEKYKNFDKSKINIKDNRILSRITYIVMPIWKLDEFAQSFQSMIL